MTGRELLRRSLHRHRGPLAGAAALGVLAQFAVVALPAAVRSALDDGVTRGAPWATVGWSAAVLGLGAVAVAATVGEQRLNYLSGARVVRYWRTRLAARVLADDVRGVGHGDLVARHGRDADQLWQWVGGVVQTVQLVVGVVVTLVAIGLLDPLLALVGLGTVVPLVALTRRYPARYEAASAELARADAERVAAVVSLVDGAETARATGAERTMLALHDGPNTRVATAAVRLADVNASWSATAGALPLAGAAVGLLVGGLALARGEVTIGGLTAFAAWTGVLALQTEQLATQQAVRRAAAASAARIAAVLDDGLSCVTSSATPLPARGWLRGELPSATVDVGPGETVVVNGPTGAGKTTLLRTLAGLDAPASGSVTFGGTPLAGAGQLRERIGFVGQRPVLVSGSLRENVRLARPDAPAADLAAVSRAAALTPVVDALASGWDTPVGEAGTALSGGQVQRVALARALLARPAVLVLDDITSALDAATAAHVGAAVRVLDPELAVVWGGPAPAGPVRATVTLRAPGPLHA